MSASDYISVNIKVSTVANRVEIIEDVAYLVPKSSLLVSLGEKFDTDFAAQNGAVTSSQLDVDYAAALADS